MSGEHILDMTDECVFSVADGHELKSSFYISNMCDDDLKFYDAFHDYCLNIDDENEHWVKIVFDIEDVLSSIIWGNESPKNGKLGIECKIEVDALKAKLEKMLSAIDRIEYE